MSRKLAGPQVQKSALGGQKRPVAGTRLPSVLNMLVPTGLELPNIELDAWLRQHGRLYQRLAVRRAPDLGARRVSDPLFPPRRTSTIFNMWLCYLPTSLRARAIAALTSAPTSATALMCTRNRASRQPFLR